MHCIVFVVIFSIHFFHRLATLLQHCEGSSYIRYCSFMCTVNTALSYSCLYQNKINDRPTRSDARMLKSLHYSRKRKTTYNICTKCYHTVLTNMHIIFLSLTLKLFHQAYRENNYRKEEKQATKMKLFKFI